MERQGRPPLTAEKLGEVRVKVEKQAKAFDVVKEILLYLIFLLVIYTIGYTNRDPRSFSARDNIYNMMVYKQKDKRPGLVNVSLNNHRGRQGVSLKNDPGLSLSGKTHACPI